MDSQMPLLKHLTMLSPSLGFTQFHIPKQTFEPKIKIINLYKSLKPNFDPKLEFL